MAAALHGRTRGRCAHHSWYVWLDCKHSRKPLELTFAFFADAPHLCWMTNPAEITSRLSSFLCRHAPPSTPSYHAPDFPAALRRVAQLTSNAKAAQRNPRSAESFSCLSDEDKDEAAGDLSRMREYAAVWQSRPLLEGAESVEPWEEQAMGRVPRPKWRCVAFLHPPSNPKRAELLHLSGSRAATTLLTSRRAAAQRASRSPRKSSSRSPPSSSPRRSATPSNLSQCPSSRCKFSPQPRRCRRATRATTKIRSGTRTAKTRALWTPSSRSLVTSSLITRASQSRCCESLWRDATFFERPVRFSLPVALRCPPFFTF